MILSDEMRRPQGCPAKKLMDLRLLMDVSTHEHPGEETCFLQSSCHWLGSSKDAFPSRQDIADEFNS